MRGFVCSGQKSQQRGLAAAPLTHRYQQAELINGRTAMTGVAGILFTSVRARGLLLRWPLRRATPRVALNHSNVPRKWCRWA
jgi:hypothetical protein